MIIEFIINGEKCTTEIKENIPYHVAITKIRETLKKQLKKEKKECKLWFTNIIK